MMIISLARDSFLRYECDHHQFCEWRFEWWTGGYPSLCRTLPLFTSFAPHHFFGWERIMESVIPTPFIIIFKHNQARKMIILLVAIQLSTSWGALLLIHIISTCWSHIKSCLLFLWPDDYGNSERNSNYDHVWCLFSNLSSPSLLSFFFNHDPIWWDDLYFTPGYHYHIWRWSTPRRLPVLRSAPHSTFFCAASSQPPPVHHARNKWPLLVLNANKN